MIMAHMAPALTMIPPPGADHGREPADSVRGRYGEARQLIDTLQHIGIDFGHVMQGLEDDAVTKFEDAWRGWNT
jgi:hypothetical protein